METEYQGTGMDYGYNATYIDSFCNKYHPDTDGIELYESTMPAYYFYNRDEILTQKIPFTKDQFNQFKELQESIKTLGLNADALFELLAFLYFQIIKISNFRMENYAPKLDEINQFILQNLGELHEVTLRAGRKTMKINKDVLEYFVPLFHSFKEGKPVQFVKNQFTLRRCSYIMIKNLDMALKPYVNINKPENVAFTNKERDFYLRILHLCGYLLGEIDSVCYASGNSATFNKLMRDFDGEKFSISGLPF